MVENGLKSLLLMFVISSSSSIFTFALDLAYSSSIFSFSSLILADYFFSMNSTSANNSAIPSLFFWAWLLRDDLFDDALDEDLFDSAEDCAETSLCNPCDIFWFFYCSVSFIQLWILFLKSIISTSMLSNHSTSFSCKLIGSRELRYLCTSISILKTL